MLEGGEPVWSEYSVESMYPTAGHSGGAAAATTNGSAAAPPGQQQRSGRRKKVIIRFMTPCAHAHLQLVTKTLSVCGVTPAALLAWRHKGVAYQLWTCWSCPACAAVSLAGCGCTAGCFPLQGEGKAARTGSAEQPAPSPEDLVAAELERMQVGSTAVRTARDLCECPCKSATDKQPLHSQDEGRRSRMVRQCSLQFCSQLMFALYTVRQVQKAKDKAIQAALAAAEADYEADRQKAARRAQPANVKKVSLCSTACHEVTD